MIDVIESEFEELLARPESETFERKGGVDPNNTADMLLKVAKPLIAMANTEGGTLLIGQKGKPYSDADLHRLDSAAIDDLVNKCVEPRAGNITTLPSRSKEFVKITIEESTNKPHVIQKTRTCLDEQGRDQVALSQGTILVRHSSKTEPANRADIERMLEEYRNKIFEQVKMVFEVTPGQEIVIVPSPDGALPVKVSEEEDALPVRQVLTTEPFLDFGQELKAGIKAWKTSGQLLNRAQICKAYVAREKVESSEEVELVLRSALHHWYPGYVWAGKLGLNRTTDLLAAIVEEDAYPECRESLKVASLLPSESAQRIFGIARGSSKWSVHLDLDKFAEVIKAPDLDKKVDTLSSLLYTGKTFRYSLQGKQYSVTKRDMTPELLTALAQESPHPPGNKRVLKVCDLEVYGRELLGESSL